MSGMVKFDRYEPDYQNHVMVSEDMGEYVRFEDMSAIIDRLLHGVSMLNLSEEQAALFTRVVNGEFS